MLNAPLRLLGSLAVRHGMLRAEQIPPLLEEQRRSRGVPFGEIARRRGLLSARQVRYLLDVQRGESVDPSRTSLGSLALHNELVSEPELGQALAAQRESRRPLGELLLEGGALEAQERDALLAAQRRLREGAANELDFETRLLPVAADPPPSERPEPRGWLIQESGDDLGRLHPLGDRALLGRLPEHDVAVPDLGASRDHAVIEFAPALGQHVISDLDSRNGTFVNGAQLIRPRPLQPGDRLRVGSTLFRYVNGGGQGARVSLVKRPAAAAPERPDGPSDSDRRREQVVSRRDFLLERLGQAAISADPHGGATLGARHAERKLEEARRGGDAAGIRWAERRRIDALRELGRSLVARGPAPEGWMPVVVEIRELDAELSALVPEVRS